MKKRLNKRGQMQSAAMQEDSSMNDETSDSMQPTDKTAPAVTDVGGKKSKWWLWLIIVLVVIGVGVGAYMMLR